MSTLSGGGWPGWQRRLSLNQRTTPAWDIPALVAAAQRHGLESVGLWREPIAEFGVKTAAAVVRDAGLRVSTLCRGGFLTGFDGTDVIADNRSAIDEAAELDAAALVLVVGGLPAASTDLPGARARVAERLEELVDHATRRGVRLGLEPLHPMFCADRSVLCSLSDALQLSTAYPAERVGIVVDTFHLWWDSTATRQIAAAGSRIVAVQLADILTPIPADPLLSRAMMGDGHIDFVPFLQAIRASGYGGDVEVEIFNADVWRDDPDTVVDTMVERYGALLTAAASHTMELTRS